MQRLYLQLVCPNCVQEIDARFPAPTHASRRRARMAGYAALWAALGSTAPAHMGSQACLPIELSGTGSCRAD
jgi:hypothetical protein